MGLISQYHVWTDGYIPMGLISADRLNTNLSRLYNEINGLLDEANIENPCKILISDRNYSGSYIISGYHIHSNYIQLNACNELRFADTDSSNYVGFRAPGTISANKIWVLPSVDGTSGQTLITNGSGVLSFSAHPHALDDLSDVNAGTPANNDSLTWDSVSSKWIPETVSSASYDTPFGSILAWVGGYFTADGNVGYTRTLGATNDVAGANGYLNGFGWYVCNGAALNITGSPIYAGAGRYLPQLTDERFIQGYNVAGGTGGENLTAAHSHGVGTLAIAAEATHTHGAGSYAAAAEAAHTHGVGSYAAGSHYHGTTVAVNLGTLNPLKIGNFYGTDASERVFQQIQSTDELTQTHDWARTSTVQPSFSGTSEAGSSHNHGFSGTSAAGSSHSHGISGNTGATSSDENRPKYLSVFYIQRVI